MKKVKKSRRGILAGQRLVAWHKSKEGRAFHSKSSKEV
jgi:hypothetical protein